MKNTNSQIDAALLLEQTGWLRALAWNLVGDTHRAEELTQDTLLTALDRPPRQASEGVALRAWLAKVARNLARSAHRGDRHRAAREAASASSERLPSVEDAVERTELRQRLVEAILELRTPYREVVILRHLEGLTNAEIAERTGATPEAVRTRLSRGLAMLRERLDEEYGGDRRAWLAVCLPLARESKVAGLAAASTGIGWVVTKTLAAAGLAIALVFVGLNALDGAEPGASEVASLSPAAQDPQRVEPEALAPTAAGVGARTALQETAGERDATDARAALPSDESGLELRLVPHPASPEYARGESFPRFQKGPSVVLGPPRRYVLEDAKRALDIYGSPAVRVRVAASERQAFVTWTAENLNERLAIVVDDVVLSMATLKSPLESGELLIEGAGSFSEADVVWLLAALGFPEPGIQPYGFAGLVVDGASGAPVSRASVTRGGEPPVALGPNGAFTLRVASATEEVALVTAPGYAAVGVGLSRDSGAPGQVQRIPLDRLGELSVRVLEADGTAIPDAKAVLSRVDLRGSLEPAWLELEFLSARSAANELGVTSLLDPVEHRTGPVGEAHFADLFSNVTYQLIVSTPGVEPSSVTLPGSGAEGEAAEGSATADLQTGALEAWPSRRWTTTLSVAAGEQRELEVRLPGCAELAGRVVGPDGQALPRVVVQALPADGARPALRPMQLPEVHGVESERTDEQGYFRFAGLQEGRYIVGVPFGQHVRGAARSPLAAHSVDVVVAEASAAHDEVVLELAPAYSITGAVFDAKGAPVAGQSVWLSSGEMQLVFADERSDSKGRFRFHGLAEGSYSLTTSIQAIYAGMASVVEAGDSDVQLLHAPCTLRVRLAGPETLEQARASVLLHSRASSPPAGRRLQRADARTQHLIDLEPGRYDVVVRSRDGRVAIASGVELGVESREVDVELTLEPGAAIEMALSPEAERRLYRVVRGDVTVAASWLDPGSGDTALVPEGRLRVELLDRNGTTLETRSLEARAGRVTRLVFDR